MKQELIHNPNGFLPVPLPAIAQDLSDNFPSSAVVKFLATPLRHQNTLLASGNLDIDSLCLACLEAYDDTSEDGVDNGEVKFKAAN